MYNSDWKWTLQVEGPRSLEIPNMADMHLIMSGQQTKLM